MPESSSRRGWLIGGLALAAGAAGWGSALWRDRQAGQREALDADIWQQAFDQPAGGELAMHTFKGKPLLVNFWATWCPPCVEEMPMIDAFYKEQSRHGWQVLGLAIDQPSAVRKFLERTPVSYPIGMAGLGGTELVKRLGNASGGLPFTLVVSADGYVTARKMGKLSSAELDAWRRA